MSIPDRTEFLTFAADAHGVIELLPEDSADDVDLDLTVPAGRPADNRSTT